ncbi:hypothetical protein F5B22DRAFT_596797 [Xylaria bambusicola]|uniref:uncharacterized protein n=1 Tax=Xylaria bambusicola TaxID=326684 RepID=UPI0020080D40|nr:uncharacterized protein F5B22DRAFT_596797 [Xylaria bambusicola]KAI0521430.1 hypothetical protein F5B22DRAFT_596797 [Xylaria bambusicola]
MNSQPSQFDSYKEIVDHTQPGLELRTEPTKPWAPAPYYSPPVQEPTVCGVRRTTFLLSVALAVVIIVAAVGGGVGGSIAVNNAKSACNSHVAPDSNVAAATTTVTATVTATGSPSSTTGIIVVPTGMVKLDCPGGLDNDMAITLGDKSWTFKPTCDVDYSGGDFGAVIAYSFHDCLQACAAHNSFSGKDECTAITYRTDQTKYIPSNYGNCWLKRGDNPTAYLSNTASTDPVAGAVLKSST